MKQKIYIFGGVVILFAVIVIFYFFIPNTNKEYNRQKFFVAVLSNINPTNQHNLNGQTDYNFVYDESQQNGFVINKSGYTIKNDLINKNRYEYFSHKEQPFEHFTRDVYPWLQWGNDTPLDITTKNERVDAYILDFLDAMDIIKNNFYKKKQNFDKNLKKNIAFKFWNSVFNDEELKKYNFSRNDIWIGNDVEFQVLKDTLKKVLKKKIIEFTI
ncbi:MAG: hypothetical protein LBT02_00375 [Rickettsiales bacterium]|jgi:hypothetical protein|nr:hypothetical protein [Rickettsiales bacterium]